MFWLFGGILISLSVPRRLKGAWFVLRTQCLVLLYQALGVLMADLHRLSQIDPYLRDQGATHHLVGLRLVQLTRTDDSTSWRFGYLYDIKQFCNVELSPQDFPQ